MKSPIPAEMMMKTISYYYLVNYCPASHVGELRKAAKGLREELAGAAGLESAEYFKRALPEVCWRIVAFHQATREPDPALVERLHQAGGKADRSKKGATEFQQAMAEIAALPGRSKPGNRLHRQKGCRYCAAPCRYGYFTMVSDPVFHDLLSRLTAENQKPKAERDPVGVLWTFTGLHLGSLLGSEGGHVRADHLGNLAYCLLMLATARSRYPVPEAQLQTFQALNQAAIAAR
ncbi:MAG: hypothetical protein ACK2T2_14960 [Anaerolineales bacterium]